MADRLNGSGLTFLRFDANKAKNAGGLSNFLSGSRVRAPRWMKQAGLEWAWRIWLEPRRLFWRYLTTNPRALYLLLNRSRHSNRTHG